MKDDIRLPKSDKDWTIANDYFDALFTGTLIDSNNVDKVAEQLGTSIYDYFKTNSGSVKESIQCQLDMKYSNHSARELKKDLKRLKDSYAPLREIKYVSHLLRSKIKSAPSIISASFSHNSLIDRNLWSYVKRVLQKKSSLLPTFTLSDCAQYIHGILSDNSPNKRFAIPSWIPQFQAPTHGFSLQLPSYQKVAAIVRRMKASASPSPLEQISIICFKRCPYLHSLLTEIIHIIWNSGSILSLWKNACTILIYKNGSTDDPSNFMPISLESVMLKILTSCLRDAIYDFLRNNIFVDSHIQKGFTSKISGTLEHTSMMGHIVNKARTKQRSLIVTLLDLKNAFGEVHHNLISSVLSYHHIPTGIKSLIMNLYTNFRTSIITKDISSPAIPVNRGVLQGDCLSPLLFNMCFNTFIQFIKAEKFKQLAFSGHDGTNHLFNPVHWFQFADDAAVTSSTERENQLLLNCFTRWCQWAHIIIRVDKCTTFGIKIFSTCSMQFQPKLLINNETVPPVEKEASFRYLGRYFNFEMNSDDHMASLKTSFSNMLSEIDSLPILPQNKLRLYQTYLLSKASWDFTATNISKT